MPESPRRLTPERALEMAGRHILRGNRAEAAAICEKVLAAVPEHADALHMLGGCAMLDGRLGQAGDLFDRALARRPDDPAFLANKGTVMLNLGLSGPAVDLLRRALDIKPEMAPAWDTLGRALQSREQWEEATEAYRRAIGIDAAYARAHAHLASLYRHEGRGREAREALREALRLNPENPDILAEAASHFIGGAFLTRARGFLDKALKLDPNHPEATLARAEFLEMAGQGDAARRVLCGALARRPSAPHLRLRMANLLLSTGYREAAEEVLRGLLEDMPNHPGALTELAAVGALGRGDPETERMETLARRDGLAAKPRAALHFALAQVGDKAGDHDWAFGHLAEANRLRQAELTRQGRAYDAAFQDRRMADLKRVFDAAFFAERRGWGVDSRRPVIIAGMPRSGTTLVEQIIAAHPRAAGAGELMDLPHLSMILPTVAASGDPFPDCLPALTAEGARKLADAYDRRLADWAPNALRVTNKLPGNYTFLGLAGLLFPDAAFIHCRRDPMDNALSNYFANFQDGLAASFDLAAQGHAWTLYADLMRHWREVLPVTVLDVDYEALVADPEPQVRRLLAHCGLGWDPACLAFHTSHRAIRTASRAQVRNPIYASSAGRWRRYEAHLDELRTRLEGVGY